MKVLIPVEVSDQVIEDFLTTTIESGGSNSWLEIRPKVGYFRNELLELEYLTTLWKDGFEVLDAETQRPFCESGVYRISDDSWDDLTVRKERTSFEYHDLVWGFQIIAKTEPQLIHQLIDESYDADTCDRIMQYILFGEQIFG